MKSPVKETGRRGIAHRQEKASGENGCEGDEGGSPEHPGSGIADDHALPQELRDVIVGLQERGSLPPREQGLCPGNHAHEEGRKDDQQDEVDKYGGHKLPPILLMANRRGGRTTSRTRWTSTAVTSCLRFC